jgi:hypothetical protein
VVDHDRWPESHDAAFALVALVLSEILSTDKEGGDLLLADFMRTAWPSPRAARQ